MGEKDWGTPSEDQSWRREADLKNSLQHFKDRELESWCTLSVSHIWGFGIEIGLSSAEADRALCLLLQLGVSPREMRFQDTGSWICGAVQKFPSMQKKHGHYTIINFVLGFGYPGCPVPHGAKHMASGHHETQQYSLRPSYLYFSVFPK